LIVTSNKPFSAWGEIVGDDATAAAMIDRLVHHAEILSLKATAIASRTTTSPDHQPSSPGKRTDPGDAPAARARGGGQFSTGATGSILNRP
jgi:hypothetical protein